MKPIRTMTLVALAAILNAGCAAVALTAAGVGGGAMAYHQMGGYTYRTFTEPLPKVRSAVLLASKRMAIQPGKPEKIELGERLMAHVGDRDIEIELESLTPNVTRMRCVVRRQGAIVMDSSTAVEIISQTEKALGSS